MFSLKRQFNRACNIWIRRHFYKNQKQIECCSVILIYDGRLKSMVTCYLEKSKFQL